MYGLRQIYFPAAPGPSLSGIDRSIESNSWIPDRASVFYSRYGLTVRIAHRAKTDVWYVALCFLQDGVTKLDGDLFWAGSFDSMERAEAGGFALTTQHTRAQ